MYRQGMTFEPRSMVAQKEAFGYTSGLPVPADGVDPSDHRYRGAMVQHILARMVREGLRHRGLNVTSFVESIGDVPGLSADRLRRVLRGETSATFADLAFFVSEFPATANQVAAYVAHWAKGAPESRG